MSQAPLFPDTSLLAWDRVQPKLPEKYQKIVAKIAADKTRDWTGQELAPSIPGAWKRLPEMERLGLIRRTRKRQCKVTGEYAWGWELV